jgi:cullin-4
VSENDMFFVNFSLKEKSYRLKINQLHAKSRGEENNNEGQDEIQQTRKEVIRDRQMEVQAAIIRIMKSRKELKHVELIQQTIQQTIERGALDVADIKKNIDRLIDKEFLERVGTDSYRYI